MISKIFKQTKKNVCGANSSYIYLSLWIINCLNDKLLNFTESLYPPQRHDVVMRQLLVKPQLLGNRYEFRVQCECDDKGERTACAAHIPHFDARASHVSCRNDGAVSKLLRAVVTLNSASGWDRCGHSQTSGQPHVLHNCTGLHRTHPISKAVKPHSEVESCEEASELHRVFKGGAPHCSRSPRQPARPICFIDK